MRQPKTGMFGTFRWPSGYFKRVSYTPAVYPRGVGTVGSLNFPAATIHVEEYFDTVAKNRDVWYAPLRVRVTRSVRIVPPAMVCGELYDV